MQRGCPLLPHLLRKTRPPMNQARFSTDPTRRGTSKSLAPAILGTYTRNGRNNRVQATTLGSLISSASRSPQVRPKDRGGTFPPVGDIVSSASSASGTEVISSGFRASAGPTRSPSGSSVLPRLSGRSSRSMVSLLIPMNHTPMRVASFSTFDQVRSTAECRS